MSNLVDHARVELELIYKEGDDEMGTVEGILKVLEAFSDMGHSGGSASVVIPWVTMLLNFQNLTPLTNNPNEWQEHMGQTTSWQNRRRYDAFSEDGGLTHYLLDNELSKKKILGRWKRRRTMYTARNG